MPEKPRILLSVPHMGGSEQGYANEAFRLNWVSTVGPNINAFEAAFAKRIGLHSVCLDSGTAAIHLGLRLLGVCPGDEVFCPTLTFAASANPIRYLGAEPVFLDSERRTWNLDAEILRQALRAKAATNRLPKALIVVDLYGQGAEMEPILEAAREYEVPVLEDAAEALGASYKGQPAGTFGRVAAFSFNGNKIITTGGGGMLMDDDKTSAEHVRHLATQARDPAPHYEHSEIGFNYRLSNLLAALGRSQLADLPRRVARRRSINARYRAELAGLPVDFMPQASYGRPTCWLTCITVDSDADIGPEAIRVELGSRDIEARPTWKPMHRQPAYVGAPSRIDGTSDRLFSSGLCLPSGSSLTDDEQTRVIEHIIDTFQRAG